ARLVLGSIDTAEREARPAQCLAPREAGALVLVGLVLEMKPELVVQLALHAIALKERAQAVAEIREHDYRPGSMFITSDTAAVSLSQASASAPSCFRPARVSW